MPTSRRNRGGGAIPSALCACGETVTILVHCVAKIYLFSPPTEGCPQGGEGIREKIKYLEVYPTRHSVALSSSGGE